MNIEQISKLSNPALECIIRNETELRCLMIPRHEMIDIVWEITNDHANDMPRNTPKKESRCAGCNISFGRDIGEAKKFHRELVWVRETDRKTVKHPPKNWVWGPDKYRQYYSFWCCENCSPIPDMADPYLGGISCVSGEALPMGDNTNE